MFPHYSVRNRSQAEREKSIRAAQQVLSVFLRVLGLPRYGLRIEPTMMTDGRPRPMTYTLFKGDDRLILQVIYSLSSCSVKVRRGTDRGTDKLIEKPDFIKRNNVFYGIRFFDHTFMYDRMVKVRKLALVLGKKISMLPVYDILKS